jgi:hypothetical protein
MSIERAIHERFRTWQPLVDRVPAERFSTGWLAPNAEGTVAESEPYVILERGPQRAAERMSDGRTLVTLLVRFYVQASSLSTAWEIAAEIHHRFERQAFSSGETQVQDMKRQTFQHSARLGGGWQIVLEYLARVEE